VSTCHRSPSPRGEAAYESSRERNEQTTEEISVHAPRARAGSVLSLPPLPTARGRARVQIRKQMSGIRETRFVHIPSYSWTLLDCDCLLLPPVLPWIIEIGTANRDPETAIIIFLFSFSLSLSLCFSFSPSFFPYRVINIDNIIISQDASSFS